MRNLEAELKNLIIRKLDDNHNSHITYKDGTEFLIHADLNSSPIDIYWSVYVGCELIVGDVSLDYVVEFLLNCHRNYHTMVAVSNVLGQI